MISIPYANCWDYKKIETVPALMNLTLYRRMCMNKLLQQNRVCAIIGGELREHMAGRPKLEDAIREHFL